MPEIVATVSNHALSISSSTWRTMSALAMSPRAVSFLISLRINLIWTWRSPSSSGSSSSESISPNGLPRIVVDACSKSPNGLPGFVFELHSELVFDWARWLERTTVIDYSEKLKTNLSRLLLASDLRINESSSGNWYDVGRILKVDIAGIVLAF